jgi:Na+/H+-dicarboxylate symporter
LRDKDNILSPEKLQFLFKPLMAILLITSILLVFYTIFLYLIMKNKTGKFYLGLLGAGLMGLVSGNTAASIVSLNEHLKRNIGVKKEVADALTPLGLILNKSGTIIISAVTLMTVILGYSPNILDLRLQISLFILLFIFSFLLDGVNEVGFLALVSMIMHIPSLHLEQDSYLLFLLFVPILSRIGIFLDIITTGIFISFSAKYTDNLDKKEYIDFI